MDKSESEIVISNNIASKEVNRRIQLGQVITTEKDQELSQVISKMKSLYSLRTSAMKILLRNVNNNKKFSIFQCP